MSATTARPRRLLSVYLSTLATRALHVQVFLTAPDGRILVPQLLTTSDATSTPVPAGQHPRTVATQQLRDHLGLDIFPGRLLCVDLPTDPGSPALVSYAGALTTGQPVTRYATALVTVGELPDLAELLGPEPVRQLSTALRAQQSTRTTLLEDGNPIRLAPRLPDQQRSARREPLAGQLSLEELLLLT